MSCVAPWSVCTTACPENVSGTPWDTSTIAPTTAIGSRMNASERYRSTQKFPSVSGCGCENPRMTAASTAIPTAAEMKFCTARPAIWVR